MLKTGPKAALAHYGDVRSGPLWWGMVGLAETLRICAKLERIDVELVDSSDGSRIANYPSESPPEPRNRQQGISCRIPGRHGFWASFRWEPLPDQGPPLMTDEHLICELLTRIRQLATWGRLDHALDLSPTEQQVLSLLEEQLTEREIATRLDRSPNTVHVHVKNIYRKLAVTSRDELAVRTQQMSHY